MEICITATSSSRYCTRACDKINGHIDELRSLGFEVSPALIEGDDCGYPERHCDSCGSASFRIDTLPAAEYLVVNQLMTEQIELHSVSLLRPLLPSLEVTQQANAGSWVTVLSFHGLRTVGRSTSAHYADLKALIDLFELLKDAYRTNPLPERARYIAQIVPYVRERIRGNAPLKGILVQAIARFCPDHPIIQRNTSGGNAHTPVFVVELEWLGYTLMKTGLPGQTRRNIEELAFSDLFNQLALKLRGGALDPDDDCCVCLEPYGEDANCVEFPCHHGMHERCMLEWRAAALDRPVEEPLACPLCRRLVDGAAPAPAAPLNPMLAVFAPLTMRDNRNAHMRHHGVLARVYRDASLMMRGPSPHGPVFGNTPNYPCGLSAILCILAAVGEFPRTYAGIILDHAAILRADRELTAVEKYARIRQAALERQQQAIAIWRELGYGRRVTPQELSVVICRLNLSVGMAALGGMQGREGLNGIGMQRLQRSFAAATGRAVFGNGNRFRPRIEILYLPSGEYGANGHFFALDHGRAYDRMAAELRPPANPVVPYTPTVVGVDGDYAGLQRDHWPLYLGALAQAAADIAGMPDPRNNRYDASGEPGFIDMGGRRVAIAAPGIDIADLGGDFEVVPRPGGPPPRPIDQSDDTGFASFADLEHLMHMEAAAEPAPAVPVHEPPAEEVPPAQPEPFVGHGLPFDMADAVLISTVTCDALPCFWVKVPTKTDTRRIHRFARNDVCTCHFSFFQIIPCQHIRRAKVLILGPGFERALCGNMLMGLGVLWFKDHYFAQMHGGNLRLTTHRGRGFWVDPAGFGTNQPIPVNPPGELIGLHYGGHSIPLGDTVYNASPMLGDGSRVSLVSPLSRQVYWEVAPALALESICEEHSILQGFKGSLLGALFGFLCDTITDPSQMILQSLATSWNAQAALMHLGWAKITTGAWTIGAILAKAMIMIHVPFIGQIFLAGFLGLLIKVGMYRLFRNRLDIGGPWADLGFLTTFGWHAVPVMMVRWLLTPGAEITQDFGTDERPMVIPGNAPELIEANNAVVGYSQTRMLTDPGIFRAAATGLINFNRAGHLLPPYLFEELVAIEAERCFHRIRLEGAGWSNTDAEFHGVVPPRGSCLNFPHCQRKLDKRGRRRNFSLCTECLKSHCNRPGRECQNEYIEALFDGVRFTGQIPLVCFRSHYYESPNETQVFIPPGCSIVTNMRRDETRHPDFCTTRKIGVGVGFVHPGWTVDHQHSGISAVVMGLMERTFQYGDPYDERAVDRYCDMVDYIAARTPDGCVDAMDDYAWVETQERKLVLGPAMHDLREGNGLLKSDLEIGVFTKSEWFCRTKPGLGIFGPSKRRGGYKKRGIYTPQDKAHCAVGPSAKPMQAHIASVFNAKSPFFYAGKATPGQLNDYLQRLVEAEPYSYILMADIARCETNKHFRVVRARMGYYRRKWSVEDAVRDRVILSWKNARFKARSKQGRCSGRLPPNMTLSGEDFTSADNSFDVAIATHLLVYCALVNVPPSQLTDAQFDECCRLWESGNVFGAGSGDDTTVVIPRVYQGQNVDKDAFFGRYQAFAIELGFKVTGMWSRAVWDIVFLGMRPYHCSDDKYRFGKLIGRSSVKNHCARQLEGHPYDWLMEVCKAEETTMPHVPLLYHKAKRVLEVLKPRMGEGRPLRKHDLYNLKKNATWLNVDGAGVTYTEKTWQDLSECYDLPVELLKNEVNRINQAQWFPYALSGEVWDRIFTVDLSY